MFSPRQSLWMACLTLILLAGSAPVVRARTEERTIQAAHDVLQQFQELQIPQIPESMLANVHAVAIIPDVIKLGFVVGGQRGHGVVVMRQPDGAWRAPMFVTITGGSIGWQAGAQATDFVLVFKSQKSVEGLLRGKFTLGADAAIAAGPVGRRAGAATDAELKAEIYSYSRSRGLFAGVSLEGSALQIDDAANANYYGTTAPGGAPQAIPLAAQQLVTNIATLAARGSVPVDSAVPQPINPINAVPSPAINEVSSTQVELSRSAANLNALLDNSWRQYLALPNELLDPSRRPNPDTVALTLQRFNSIAQNRQYQAIISRPEFQTTHQQLIKLNDELRMGSSSRLALPPPPQLPR
jgi:SH3 domain-containing YSC84-like protein 1